MQNRKRILVAPLNWGLGHATRCIPIIEALENHGFEPVIASDGIALALLKKEFPALTAIELPPYQIEYAKNGAFFKLKLITQIPNMIKAVRRENSMVQELIEKHNIQGIISDNRLGVYSKKLPCVFVTHQLNVLTGNTTWFTSKIHQMFIRKYNECWVPDVQTTPNLSGKLGHIDGNSLKVKYIGPLSRLHRKPMEKKYDLMAILSGPEPQRTMLEEKLSDELKRYKGKVIFVKGVVEPEEKITVKDNITYYNFMNTAALEQAFNESDKVLCRSGYTTIMDLAQLGKKAFFIPTPGQYEQEYLAHKLKKTGLVPYARQHSFKVEDLEKISLYKGLKNLGSDMRWKDLFSLFKGE
ncbi:glycosyltransferase [Flavobacterium salilacus subsp. salilacus]|uniref:glycosyltransferase n=1 Tax=Flavobacterium TaxID=237 RepID=UPI0010756979|nr:MULTISPECIES: glycosyltransferase [Flavobacterium]KAF2520093.1 glycosyltransferase [Flavobacterium salilacus subsp. salilacus]MBE1613991.1 glycosyltransferase [Flavobacterium sp. SaA2.13]NDI97902.1 glycosyltransferase [Flavobacterium salilacus subsp. altitudinum]